jgi:hypothetical protein
VQPQHTVRSGDRLNMSFRKVMLLLINVLGQTDSIRAYRHQFSLVEDVCVVVDARRAHIVLLSWHRRATSQWAQPQWLHLWLHSPAISKAREWPRPGRRPADTAGTVTADLRVDDLESESFVSNQGRT